MEVVTTNKKEILRLHNDLINAVFSLSVDAKKLLLVIWLHANPEDKKNIVEVYQQDIQDKVGIDIMHLNPKHREEIVLELMTKIITIKDINNPNNFTKFALLRDTEYKDGLLKVDISPYLIPYIKEARDKLFTRFNIQNIKPLTSTHAIRVYLLCKQFENTGWFKITLKDFKKKLELEKRYSRIFDLKRRVLEVAKKQINENTDILVDYELEKQGRKYTHITFKIKSKNKKIKEAKKVGTDNSFNSFRQKILSKVDENKVIILDDKTYQIKNRFLYLDDKLLSKEEALEHWNLLFKNKDKLQIKTLEEVKENNLKILEQEVNKLYVGKKTFIKVGNDYVNVVIAKVKVIDLDKIKVIFDAENGKQYAVEYGSLESIKNL
jgi:plasmid replication initiation protein